MTVSNLPLALLSSLFLLFSVPSLIRDSLNLSSDQEAYWASSRYYDSKIGKFTQPDTIIPKPGNPLAFNRFAYTFNNPLKFTDPSGHTPEDEGQKGTLTNAYVIEFAATNGRYSHLIENSLNSLVGEAGQVFLGEPIPLPPGNQAALQKLIGFEKPSDITARRISMQFNPLSPISVQEEMFRAMEYAFAGAPVYIQSSRHLTESDFSRKQRADGIPQILEDLDYKESSVTRMEIGVFNYIHVPNGSASESKFTVGRDGRSIRGDMNSFLGHEIGHLFNINRITTMIVSNIDQIDPSDRQTFINEAFATDEHPRSAEDEILRRNNGIRDFTLDFENKIVRPSLNKTFGYERYKKREYYYRDTYSKNPRGLWQR